VIVSGLGVVVVVASFLLPVQPVAQQYSRLQVLFVNSLLEEVAAVLVMRIVYVAKQKGVVYVAVFVDLFEMMTMN